MKARVRNWERWQSYRKDRGQPPWIKVHRRLMHDPSFVSLTDAQRGQLVCMWILAADRDGEIPADPAMIAKLCCMDTTPDLQVFAEHGFIELDANVTSEWRQCDVPEAEAEAEAEAKTETDSAKRKKRATQLPSDWQPSDSHRERARAEGLDVEREAEKFRSHAAMTGRTLKNWNAGFTTWLLNAKDFSPRGRERDESAEWADREIARFRQREQDRTDGLSRLSVER